MIINDRVYGIVEINEPVLIELINSKPVQRLKGINQAGASQYAIKGKTVSRYEHSVGVMLLLKKLGASLEEQIAGLLHDIPHTAFSHTIDFVFPNKDHNFHERFHEKIIKESEIPEILERYGFVLERLLNEHNFPLLEKKIPDLCADRIDYALRDMIAIHGFSEKISSYIQSLVIHDKEIIFSDKNIARTFAEDFISFDEKVWSYSLELALFQLLAAAMKTGLDSGILVKQDLFQDDDFVYNKLKNSNNQEILRKLEMINPNLRIIETCNDYDFFSESKLRYVDPRFIIITERSEARDKTTERSNVKVQKNIDSLSDLQSKSIRNAADNIAESIGKELESDSVRDATLQTKRVSEAYPEFRQMLKNHIEKIEKGNFIKIKKW